MEGKDDILGQPSPKRPRRTWRDRCSGISIIILLVCSTLASYCLIGSHLGWTKSPFTADGVTRAVGHVVWGSCDTWSLPRAECGSIIVPLDYFDRDAGTASIALARYPASKTPKKGIVLFNPGGPGGSGKFFIARAGPALQAVVGEDYDVVGFDPRGIGESEPKTQCFDGDLSYTTFARNTILARSYDTASNLSLPEARDRLVIDYLEADALYHTQFDICRKTMGDKLKYMGTSTVVRDIDFITTQLEGPEAFINFYGFSYGTILGQYLVNMFPDRIGRVAIDGVADAVAWATKPYYTWYKDWLSSTTPAYDIFLTRCSEVGPAICPLAKKTGEDPSRIRDRIEVFVDGLYYKPIPVPFAGTPGVLTSGRARMYLLMALQRPSNWQVASAGLAQAIAGNGTFVMDATELVFGDDMARQAVSCNDNAPFKVPPAEEVVDALLDVFHNVSRLGLAVVTTEPDAGCQYWPVTPPERFQGPWNHTLSSPILILSNSADPVTPISSGKLVNKLLGSSSRLLVQDSPGHCTLALPSSCTLNATRSYFADGTLPAEGTVCKTDFPPFSDPEELASAFASGEEGQRLEAQAQLEQILPLARRGLPFDQVLLV